VSSCSSLLKHNDTSCPFRHSCFSFHGQSLTTCGWMLSVFFQSRNTQDHRKFIICALINIGRKQLYIIKIVYIVPQYARCLSYRELYLSDMKQIFGHQDFNRDCHTIMILSCMKNMMILCVTTLKEAYL
jgi:hypothetical protein